MATEVIMPKLGLTMTEGTILNWLKREGDTVQEGEPLFEVATDKVSLEVEAPATGTVLSILVGEGIAVPLSTIIAYIGEPGEALPDLEEHPVAAPAEEHVLHSETTRAAQSAPSSEGPIKASPIAKRMAKEHGIDLNTIQGTGPQGRIIEADVQKVIDGGLAGLPSQDAAAVPSELYSLNTVKRLTARRMSESFQTAPHFYLNIELNVSKLYNMRANLLPFIEERIGIRITYTDLILRALALALPAHPLINATWVEGQIRAYKEVHLGVAMATDKGLVVGVIHRAESLSLEQTIQARAELGDKAKQDSLAPEDITGGTFTFTNLGMYGVDEFTPILNPPQSAILAAGAIIERPIGEDGQIVLRPTLRLTLAVDHRVADGVDGARFLQDLRKHLEQPEALAN